MMKYEWSDEKNEVLKRGRGICFEDIVTALEQGFLLDIIKHPNSVKYPGQKIFILKIKDYVYMVPFVKSSKAIFFKTIIPSRKMYKKYMGET